MNLFFISAAVPAGSSFFLQTHHHHHPDMTSPDTGMVETQGDQQTTVVLGGTLTLEDLRAAMQHFTQERDWDKYHSPRNLLLALVGEVGELSEIFQWRDEVERGLPDFSDEEKNHVAEEIADVLLYLIRLSDVCGFDLGQAAINKLQINAQKYPPEQVRGSPVKYNVYDPSRQRRQKYDIPTTRKQEEESGRKRARERFSEDQVAAMTELAEKAGWSITALTWEERVKFCQDFNVTKERLCNFFNNRKPKEMKRGRGSVMRRTTMPHHYDSHYEHAQYQTASGDQGQMATDDTFLKHMSE
eukprot:g5111.t2